MFAQPGFEGSHSQTEQRYRVRRRRELTKELPPGARYRLRRAPTLMIETELFTDQELVLPAINVIKQCETQEVELNKSTLHYAQPYRNFTLITSHAISPKTASESLQSRSWVRRGLVRDASLALQIAARTTLLSVENQPNHGIEDYRPPSSQQSTNTRPIDLGIRGVRARIASYASLNPPVSNLDCNVFPPRQGPETRITYGLPQEASARLNAGLSKPYLASANRSASNPVTLANSRLPVLSPVRSSSHRPGVASTHDVRRKKAVPAPIVGIATGNTSHKRDMFEQSPLSSGGIHPSDMAPSVASMTKQRHTIKNSMRGLGLSVYSHNRTDSNTSSITMVQSPSAMSSSSWERKSSLVSSKERQNTLESKLRDTPSSLSNKGKNPVREPEAHKMVPKGSLVISGGKKESSAATASPERKQSLDPKTTKPEKSFPVSQKQTLPFSSTKEGSIANASLNGHDLKLQGSEVIELTPTEARLFYPLRDFVQAGSKQDITVRDFAPPSVTKAQTDKESKPKNVVVESETRKVLQEKRIYSDSLLVSEHAPTKPFQMELETSRDPPIDLFEAFRSMIGKAEEDSQDKQTPSSLQQNVGEPNTASQCMAPKIDEIIEKGKQISLQPSTEHKPHPTAAMTPQNTAEKPQKKGKKAERLPETAQTAKRVPRKVINITRSNSGKRADYAAPTKPEKSSSPPRASKMPRLKNIKCCPLPPSLRAYYKTTRVFNSNNDANASQAERQPFSPLQTAALNPQLSTPNQATSPPDDAENPGGWKPWSRFACLVRRLGRYLQQQR